VAEQSSESLVLVKGSASLQKRRRPFLRLLFFLVVSLSALSVPQIFRAGVWLLLHEEALRQGGRLRLTVTEGSLWEPIVMKGIQLSVPTQGGGRIRLQAERCQVEGTLRPLLNGGGSWRFLEKVQVFGGILDWDLGGVPVEGSSLEIDRWPMEGLNFGGVLKLPLPVTLDLNLNNVRIRSKNWSLNAEGLGTLVSEVAPGTLKVSKLEVSVGHWKKVFAAVSGKTALQGDTLKVGEITLMDGFQLESLSASPSKNEGGGLLDLEMEMKTFGGDLRLVAQVGAPSSEIPLEASGTFANLGVAPLAAFLNFTEAAGGMLVAGKFSFRGQPANPARATASLRIEARNFQWESRQWDELVVGATLLDRRIQIPEFVLKQGQNQLQLNGDMQWPGEDAPWWRSDFGVNLTARVENLTELSALLLPEFKYVAGGLTVDGAVRSQGGVLGGALIVSGANMTWRSAPVEELHAAVKLQGSEVQVLNVEAAQGSDWVRGKGTLMVGQPWSYKGELHGNIRDLGKYATMLQPPVDLDPYAGGVELEWSGKGGSQGNEGRIHARFSQLRPFRPHVGWKHPVSGEIDGTYRNSWIELGSLDLTDGQVRLRTGMKVGPEGVELHKLTVQHGERTSLEGDALIPKEWVDQWSEVSLSGLLKSTAPFACNLSARGLDLALVGRLPGVPIGLEGILDGQWQMKGTLGDLSGSGNLSLRKGAVALDSGSYGSIEADLSWESHALRARHVSWASASGIYDGTAALEWKPGGEAPSFEASVSCPQATWQGPPSLRFILEPDPQRETPRDEPVSIHGKAAWKVSGLLSAPLLSAEVVVRSVDFQGVPDIRPLFKQSELGSLEWARSRNPLIKDWKLQLRVTSTDGAAVLGTPGAARFDLHAGGTPGRPLWHGEMRLALRASAAGVPLEVEPLVLKFSPTSEQPEVELRARGQSGTHLFSASALGPLGSPVRKYESEPAEHAEKVRSVFEESKSWDR
jgi:hypothetical protein